MPQNEDDSQASSFGLEGCSLAAAAKALLMASRDERTFPETLVLNLSE